MGATSEGLGAEEPSQPSKEGQHAEQPAASDEAQSATEQKTDARKQFFAQWFRAIPSVSTEVCVTTTTSMFRIPPMLICAISP
jgi:hypothetical protein